MKILLPRVALCAALLVCAPVAMAGSYVRTTDGRTLVWNNYPKSDDRAEWSGARDSAGYATGPGTLTWHKGRVFASRYSGTMVGGKWNGVVDNQDADGKKFRGTYVNGNKSGDWVQLGASPVNSSRSAGRGSYQKTADGRAYVWNNYPKPDDQAIWEGETDTEGYATGVGKLSWYKNGAWVSNYLGSMVRGKWNGVVVNQDADGKKFQGTFVDGVKTTDWTQVSEFNFRPELTPEQKALNERWAAYLKEIQDDNAFSNWSAPPYDLYVSKR